MVDRGSTATFMARNLRTVPCTMVMMLIHEDIHDCQVAADDALNLGGAVLIFLEGAAGEPSAEGRLDLSGGPGSDFKVALGKPAAHELEREWKRGWCDVRRQLDLNYAKCCHWEETQW